MKLTKDEARILGEILKDAKYEFNDAHHQKVRLLKYGLFTTLSNLEDRLIEAGKDKRRTGRTSQNDLSDCIKRFIGDYHFNMMKK